MTNGASRRRRRNRAAVPVLPDEIVLWEILVRVPAKELLRCRAACRSWRRLTSDPAFLLAHHRRQPSLPLVRFATGKISRDTVDVLDLRGFPAVRRLVLGFNTGHRSYHRDCVIHASYHGLLLLSFYTHHRLHLCNPATRKWLTLRELSIESIVAALYPHRPSGEYRILYWEWDMDMDGGPTPVYYVLTVGSGQQRQRCIGASPSPSMTTNNDRTCWAIHARGSSFILLHDCLHWYTNMRDGGGKIIVFDTVAEPFRWMQPPPGMATSSAPHVTHVLQMNGTLGMVQVHVHAMNAEAWVLHDHENEIWSPKFRIRLPVEEMGKDPTCVGFLYDVAVVSENGDMLFTGGNCPSSVSMFHCNDKGKLVEKFLCEKVDPLPLVLQLRYKESLVSHSFFKRKDGKRFRMPRPLRGLY